MMDPSAWDPEGTTTVLGPQGEATDVATAEAADPKSFYKELVAARCLTLRLDRSRLPMWASPAGEEAVAVAAARALEASDWIYPGRRDGAVALARGIALEELARQILGQRYAETGGRSLPGELASERYAIAHATEALGHHLAFAAGHAHGMRLSGESSIAAAICGEGTATTGVFHETLALASGSDLPFVIIVKSQTWPESAPAEAGVLGDAVADRAKAAGLWTRRVDGADPLALEQAIADGARRARAGRGPALIEAVVTHLRHEPPGHRDPVERLRRYLDKQGVWTPTFQDVTEAEIRQRLERAFDDAEEVDA